MASEVMKVKLVAGITNSENDLLTVASGHTYTVLNLSLCETAGAAETFQKISDSSIGQERVGTVDQNRTLEDTVAAMLVKLDQ